MYQPSPNIPPFVARAVVDHWLDHPRFCREALTIKDKAGRIVPLYLTPAQIALDNAIKRQERAAKPVRGIILKARRVHISVAVCAQAYHRSFFPNYQSLLVSHLDESASANAQYVKHFDKAYRTGPGYLGQPMPKVIESNAEGLAWEHGSKLRIATARNVDFSRGGTSFQFQHLTEFAFWPQPEATMRGLGQTIPTLPGTIQIIESSANGMGGLFYDLWMDAQRKDSDYFALFFAWHEHPEYRLPIAPQDMPQFQDSMSREERDLMRQYSLTPEQVAWRRWCIKNNCQGSTDTFHQEYPSCPEEAFLTSGRPRFDLISIARQPVKREALTGSLALEQVGLRQKAVFTARQDGRGEIEIYERPQPGVNYVIGADVAQGIDVSARQGGASDPDYSVACVLEATTGRQVASFRERWTPGRFAELLYVLGAFYNWAYLVPERNRDGTAVIETLTTRLFYPMDRIWVDPGRLPHDRRPPLLEELGFLTNSTTKPQLIHALDEALRESAIVVQKPHTVAELRAFVVKADGKMEGQGAHDDEVIALALAVMGLRRAPEVFRSAAAKATEIAAEVDADIERYRAPHKRQTWNRGVMRV